MKAAVLVVHDEHTGDVLAVRRRDGTYGLPGGKVEPGETETEAVSREVAEETGLEVRHLRRIAAMPAEDGVFVAVFAGEVTGTLVTRLGEVEPCWVRPSVLTESRTSRYAAFNRAAISFAEEKRM